MLPSGSEIETWITHPDFHEAIFYGMNNNPHYNDVGVIILKQPVVNVTPAQLPPYAGFVDDLKAAHLLRQPGQGGERFTVAGYGTTLTWPPPEIVEVDGLRRFANTEYLGLTQTPENGLIPVSSSFLTSQRAGKRRFNARIYCAAFSSKY